jgi:hypothetical protein
MFFYLSDGFSQTPRHVTSNEIGTVQIWLRPTVLPFCGFHAGEFNELMVMKL